MCSLSQSEIKIWTVGVSHDDISWCRCFPDGAFRTFRSGGNKILIRDGGHKHASGVKMWTSNLFVRGSFWFPFFPLGSPAPNPVPPPPSDLRPSSTWETKRAVHQASVRDLHLSLPLSQWGSKPPPAVFAQLSWLSRPVRFIHSFFSLLPLNSCSLRLFSDSLSRWSRPIYNCCVFLFAAVSK